MPRRAVSQQRSTQRRIPRRSSGSTFLRNPSYRTATVYTATVTNGGSLPTAPSISIAGPVAAASMYFENATAGKTVWVNTTVGSGQTLTVDFSTRTVTLAGATLSGVVSVDSRWWDLAPGNNTVRSNVGASVSFRDAFA